ncbi:MAG: MoaD/ThiS family protein [bacterium]|nr:MoaD/ThiS family protein [Gammaproteobacteria bacterium]HIL96761.1 MoaD/ThiS family protein [Pseudomonadales bacterium]
MALVIFSSELQEFTGEERTEVSATSYRVLIDVLVAKYSRLSFDQLTDLAVAIDGVIIVDPLLEPLSSDTEVHFLHFVAGG